ncbi:HdeD family acid-resistance protein [Dongia sedimenti]|uniref:HdeD family acid-resistance protein n=1 Tax=Dongia sedimenti TaxID=3064282 RepID=A0ABU0YJQ1_9PROT|nr:HdeD family acid-resistance protein [Rhodospirillaceae bacterium R-7]
MSTDVHSGPIDRGSAPFAGIWWLIVLRGVCGIVFGVIAVLAPGVTILSLIWVFAVYMLADGIFGLISAVMAGQRRERWGLLVAESLFNVLVGVVMLLFPTITIFTFMLLIGAWAIVTGALMIGTAINHRRDGKWPLVIGGLASVVLGIVLAAGPLIGAVVLTWWLGLYTLIFGAALVALGLKLRAIAAG